MGKTLQAPVAGVMHLYCDVTNFTSPGS
jgi:hypothetical protein